MKLNIYTGVVNLGGNSTADTVNYLPETCLVGIGETGNGLHPTFQHETQKPETLTCTDQVGNLAVAFDYNLYGP